MSKHIIKGGSFLVEEGDPRKVFSPEDFDDTHHMINNMSKSFVTDRVVPRIDEIESMAEGVTVSLIKEAGELGLLSMEIPEEYGGDETDKISSCILAENLAINGSFSTAFGSHTGIGSLPIVMFGSNDQKKKYLPDLATGEKIAAYALTEPEAGTDALNCKTKAVLSDDGKHYVLNGTKMYISNAAWANVIITYAKVDGDKFTAFIIDGDTPGVTIDPEEKKMGLKGSSTCSIILEEVKVPVENVLWKIGKGAQVAFNILNLGRFKLAAGCVGAGKYVLELAVQYALQRVQFGMPIASFNLIKNKIADMAIRIYAMESMAYRTVGMINDLIDGLEEEGEGIKGEGAEKIQEYAIECSINKVFCSEMLDLITDEGVQIHGGYGYSQEYDVERTYRDSRINRIFEGTNEINRIIIAGTLMRRAQEMGIINAAKALQQEMANPVELSISDEPLGLEQSIIDQLKKVILMLAGTAMQKYGKTITAEQEVMACLSDMIIQIFAAESMLLRTKKIIESRGLDNATHTIGMTECFISEMVCDFDKWGKAVIAAVEAGETKTNLLAALRNYTDFDPVDLFQRKRTIAESIYEAKKYVVVS